MQVASGVAAAAEALRGPAQVARPYYYLGGGRALTRLSTGVPFFVNTRDRGITTWIILGGTWENFVDDVLCALARPGGVFLDIGANQGYYTIKLAHLVGAAGRGFSFEPNPELYSVLADNVAINGLAGRIQTFPLAAGEAPGRSRLHFGYANMGGGYVDPPGGEPAPEGERGVDVEIARVDDLLPAGQTVDLIKIDAEGFEPLVLRGMRETLARSPGAAIVTEVSMAQWQRFGDPSATLGAMRGDRDAYLIGHDGRLRPLAPERLAATLSSEFISYVLLLPRVAAAERAIARFLAGD